MGGADNLSVDFTPHSYYFGCAIRNASAAQPDYFNARGYKWEAYGVNGMTGYLVEFEEDTLKELKAKIKEYWVADAARWKKAHEQTS